MPHVLLNSTWPSAYSFRRPINNSVDTTDAEETRLSQDDKDSLEALADASGLAVSADGASRAREFSSYALEALDWRVASEDGIRFARAVFDELGEGAGSVSAAELAALCLRRPDLQRPVEHAGEASPVVPLQAADIESAIEALRVAA